MHHCRRCCALLALLLTASCGAEPRVVYQPVHVPADLRRGCPGAALGQTATEGQYAEAVVANASALACANGKIVAIDEILTKAEGPQ